MCGIAGAIGFTDGKIAAAVESMSQSMRHRGPDDQGFWCAQDTRCPQLGVALAHRRLSIIDLSVDGRQPMHDRTSGMVIVYNGEVYNFRDLRVELQAEGFTFQTRTDTEVVLKAYIAWGPNCLERFRGMYAFSIWDAKQRRLFMARDRLGIKPIYYAFIQSDGGRTLLFASEVRALLASQLVPRRLDATGLATYVWNGFVNGNESIITGVRCLAAGSYATVDLEALNVSEHCHWTLPHLRNPRTPDAVQQLGRELSTAAALRLVSDVPLGVFLSGGVDSSAVSVLAAEASDHPLQTFNIGFEEVDYDESRYAKVVAQAIGAEHTQLTLTQQTFRNQLDDALGSIDQPTFDQVNTYFVSRAVREAGIKVALAGDGGDELFGGYTSFVDLPNASRWARRLSGVPTALLRRMAAAVCRWKMGTSGDVPPQTRWGKLGDVLCTRGRMVDIYQLSYSLFTEAFYEELLTSASSGASYGMSPDRRQHFGDMIGDDDSLEAISMLELANFVGQRLLRDCDAASMAVGLELRVPLLDHRVVESAARVPTQRRYYPLKSKQLLKELTLSCINRKTFDRPKSGFVLPIERWIREELKTDVEATLLDTQLCRSVGLNPQTVTRLWLAFVREVPGMYWSRVWSVFVLLWWCRQHSVSA